MSDVFLYDHIKRSKKAHWCAYCGVSIPPGSPYLSEHGIYDGAFFRRACCPDCEPLTDGFWDYVGYESSDITGDFLEYLREAQIAHPVLKKVGK